MEQQLLEIREQQKTSWNKFSSGWKKWDGLNMEFLKPMGDEIIRMIKPKSNEVVLDIAGGTGEPGLTIATMINGGKVFITDLSESMLEVASEKAIQKGIKNIETHTCDACELPFDDNTFDAITCRKGFMFFPDMLLAAKEMVRVLKPGGRLAASVWDGPEKNFWVTATMGTISKNMELPPPLPGAPGMFRCSKDGLMAEIFSEADLKNISQSYIPGKMNIRTIDNYWTLMTEVGVPIVAALNKADDAMKEKIKTEVYQIMSDRYQDGNVVLDSSALVIYGEK